MALFCTAPKPARILITTFLPSTWLPFPSAPNWLCFARKAVGRGPGVRSQGADPPGIGFVSHGGSWVPDAGLGLFDASHFKLETPAQIGFVFSDAASACFSPNPRIERQLASISASCKLGLFRTKGSGLEYWNGGIVECWGHLARLELGLFVQRPTALVPPTSPHAASRRIGFVSHDSPGPALKGRRNHEWHEAPSAASLRSAATKTCSRQDAKSAKGGGQRAMNT